jgi:hypothetical protein
MNKHVERIKTHFKENKQVYAGIAIGVGVSVVVTVGAYALMRPDVQQIAKQINIFSPKPTQIVVQFVENSTPSKPVHLVGTHKYWNSISSAAKDTGFDRGHISKNVNGLISSVKNSVFEFADAKSVV